MNQKINQRDFQILCLLIDTVIQERLEPICLLNEAQKNRCHLNVDTEFEILHHRKHLDGWMSKSQLKKEIYPQIKVIKKEVEDLLSNYNWTLNDYTYYGFTQPYEMGWSQERSIIETLIKTHLHTTKRYKRIIIKK